MRPRPYGRHPGAGPPQRHLSLARLSESGVASGASGTYGIFACLEQNSVRLLSQTVMTFHYEFNDKNAPDLFAAIAPFPLGAYHGSEVQYLFNLDERFAGINPFTHEQQALSKSVISYWTSFAENGNPDSTGQPVWLPYGSAADQFQSLVTPAPMAESTFDTDHKCPTFWNSFWATNRRGSELRAALVVRIIAPEWARFLWLHQKETRPSLRSAVLRSIPVCFRSRLEMTLTWPMRTSNGLS